MIQVLNFIDILYKISHAQHGAERNLKGSEAGVGARFVIDSIEILPCLSDVEKFRTRAEDTTEEDELYQIVKMKEDGHTSVKTNGREERRKEQSALEMSLKEEIREAQLKEMDV